MNNIYVDNVLIGVDYYKAYLEAKIIFEKASMNLREWNSNATEFLNLIPTGECINGEISKVFGLLWDHAKDVCYLSDINDVRSNGVVTKSFRYQ